MIAVYDSGLGGILSLNKIVKDYPHEKIIYFGDSKNAPYGNKPKQELLSLIDNNINMLKEMGASDIIFACNTICSIVDFNKNYDIKIHDIISKTVRQIDDIDKNAKVLVFATRASIESGRYKYELEKNGFYNGEYHCLSNLANYIENFESRDVIKEYLFDEFKKIDYNPDVIILGCTHFPVVSDIFEDYYKVPVYNSRNLHFDIDKKEEGNSLIIKMDKTAALERFLGTYLNVPYKYYD